MISGQTLDNQKINILSLKNGVYFLRFENGSSKNFKKINCSD